MAVTEESQNDLPRIATALAVILCGALSLAPALVHFDDTDSQLYTVIIRNIVRSGAWLDLHYLPSAYAQFREHLPFGFWLDALAVKLFGERAIAPVQLGETLATLWLLARLGTRMFGRWAGVGAVLFLGTSESYFLFGTRPTLEPLLVLLTTLSLAPWLLGSGWAGSALAGALATLVKGPLGLVPLACGALARAVVHRSLRTFLQGAAATALASLPATAFLLWNHWAGDDTWWRGYALGQLFASMQGARDILEPAWYPVWATAGRLVPALPFVAFALWRIRGEKRAGVLTLALTAGLLFVLLALPRRKLWSHAIIAYAPLVLLGGAGLWAVASSRRGARPAVAVLALGAVGALAFAAMGGGKRLLHAPCVVSSELSGALTAVVPQEPVWVVASDVPWGMLAILAQEKDALPQFTPDLPAPRGPRWAMVRQERMPAVHPGWRLLAQARGWSLLGNGAAPSP